MRSNLLSLQNISRQVSSTQNKLATGNKVNSAIDNPGSYYTARSLNNRADDLNALLDSMGQAVSTIKAATTALEAGADFLEQAAAVATGALETAAVPAKSYFADKGTVVTTAQELKDAVNAGKQTIIVYGKIDYFENETLTLQAGQKLVGTEYFTGYTGKAKFSQLNFINLSNSVSSPIRPGENTLISDLSISYENRLPVGTSTVIASGANNVRLRNLDLKSTQNGYSGNGSGLIALSSPYAELGGVINIEGSGVYGSGIYISNNAVVDIAADAELNIKTDYSLHGPALWLYVGATLNVYGKLNMQPTVKEAVSMGSKQYSGNTLNIHSSAEVTVASPLAFVAMGSPQSADVYNKVNIAAGAVLFLQESKSSAALLSEGFSLSAVDNYANITLSRLVDSGNFSGTDHRFSPFKPTLIETYVNTLQTTAEQYDNILHQYDSLIKDASYKGINLLQSDKLDVRFNESGSAALEVKGKDMSSAVLGLSTMDWQTQGDIAQSLSEISAALKSIRSYSAELGNNYSIITSRQDFTENLVNILTEGADKLTLADMNEESANMLALQTRQQLAINSLSLASQASQAVLKLF